MASSIEMSTSDAAGGVAFDVGIECGHGDAISLGPNKIRLTPKSESLQTDNELLVGGYNLCLRIDNPQPEPCTIDVEVDLASWFDQDWCRLPFRLPFWRRAPSSLEWQEADPGQLNTAQGVHLSLALSGEESAILSTIPHYPYSDCRRELEGFALHESGLARTVEIGRTSQGRAILATEIGPRDGRRIVVTGSQRPAEPSAWGVLAMARAILFDPSFATWRDRYRICLVPQPNPDGIVQGRCFGNAEGQPIPLDWTRPEEERTPEGRALWAYIASAPLTMFGQFDFAPATTRASDWPRPLAVDIYDPTSVALHVRLAEMSGETGLFPKDRRDPAHLQLAHHVARQWRVPVFSYRYCGPTTTPSRAEHRARHVLEAALEALEGA